MRQRTLVHLRRRNRRNATPQRVQGRLPRSVVVGEAQVGIISVSLCHMKGWWASIPELFLSRLRHAATMQFPEHPSFASRPATGSDIPGQ